ncbi:HutD family protein [Plantibacter flavus]|uniref:HutD family protein n=1 Tax=Plantibacter flavus TaxID=150123 RepID=UPI003F19114B
MGATRVSPTATVPLRPRRVLPVDALEESAWIGGGGSTRVVADDPAGWRISIATVRDGSSFSELPGVTRLHLPLEPLSIVLLGEDGPLLVGSDGAYRFDGSLAVTAHVPAGEAFALNLMSSHGGPAVAYRTLRITGPYVSGDPAVVCTVVRSGHVVTGDGRVVPAPSVIPARYHVDAEAAELIELFVEPADAPSTKHHPSEPGAVL